MNKYDVEMLTDTDNLTFCYGDYRISNGNNELYCSDLCDAQIVADRLNRETLGPHAWTAWNDEEWRKFYDIIDDMLKYRVFVAEHPTWPGVEHPGKITLAPTRMYRDCGRIFLTVE
jgi:hypothetical protein